jgi:hypothetical protein
MRVPIYYVNLLLREKANLANVKNNTLDALAWPQTRSGRLELCCDRRRPYQVLQGCAFKPRMLLAHIITLADVHCLNSRFHEYPLFALLYQPPKPSQSFQVSDSEEAGLVAAR